MRRILTPWLALICLAAPVPASAAGSFSTDPRTAYSTYFGGADHDTPSDVAIDATGAAFIVGDTVPDRFPATTTIGTSSGTGQWDLYVLKLDRDGRRVYATRIGGSATEHAMSIATDPAGNAYVFGYTNSTDFPTTTGAFQRANRGGFDYFVLKLSPRGDRLLYSTFFGGSGGELEAFGGIAVDATGSAYVTAATTSSDLPVTAGAAFATHSGTDEIGFVAKFNSGGTGLTYSTYLGGVWQQPRAITLDARNRAVVAGTIQGSAPAEHRFGALGEWDAFVIRLNETGSAVVANTRFGGHSTDIVYDVAVDLRGQAFVTGSTQSADYPAAPDYVYQPTLRGGLDAFVAEIGDNGNLGTSTFFGGTGNEVGHSIQVTGYSTVTITGETGSRDLPTRDPIQAQSSGGQDAFVAQFSGGGLELLFSTYLGGSAHDFGLALSVDGAGAFTTAGYTLSTNFPTKNAMQPAITSTTGWETFITRFAMLPRGTPGPSDIVVNVADVATTHGNWVKEGDGTAAGGFKLRNPDAGLAKVATAQANPADYIEFTVNGLFDGPYRMWIRGKADRDSYNNDSVFVQFSYAWSGQEETPQLFPIGSNEGMAIVLEDCNGCGVHGWGWQDDAYGRFARPQDLYFMPDSPLTVRIQRREDGISIDQVVFAREDQASANEPNFWSGPGYQKDDDTILPATNGRRASDVVMWAASDGSLAVTGNWVTTADTTAAGGSKLRNPDAGAAKVAFPQSAPTNYFELTFNATAGVPYRLWLRGRADTNSYNNDSVYVQFSGSVTSDGTAQWRIGTSSATTVVIEDCSGCGVHGWGWQDNGYGADAFGPVFYFAESGPQTIRIQQREDGISLDQVILSPQPFTYLNSTPGQKKDDTTIVPRTQ